MLTARKGEIDSNTIIWGYFNTPLTSMNRSSRQKIIKETQALIDTLDQIDFIVIYRVLHTEAAEYIFYWKTRKSFSVELVVLHLSSAASQLAVMKEDPAKMRPGLH